MGPAASIFMHPSCSAFVIIIIIICFQIYPAQGIISSASSNRLVPQFIEGAHETPRSFLLRLKTVFEDPAGFLSDWSNTSMNSPCRWDGVICGASTAGNHGGLELQLDDINVVGLNLSNMGISTSPGAGLPSDMCQQLPNLRFIDLSFNLMQGTFPSVLLQCRQLQHINLSGNFYVGSLPSAIDQLQALQVLDLSYNNFSGVIPEAFGHLSQLEELNLFANLLNSTGIPAHLGQLRKLKYLRLAYNPFLPAPIPPELGNLTELEVLWSTDCNLVGPMPSTLGKLANLVNMDLSGNMLTGTIPPSIFELSNLYQLELYGNRLEGRIPDNIGNLTRIVNLDLSLNNLSGPLPSTIARLHKLQSLHLNRNNLCGRLPDGLAFLPALTDLSLYNNSFSGPVPQYLGRASNLMTFDVASNNFSGPLPPYLCEGGALETLIVMNNRFSGTIPQSYVNCIHVRRLRMGDNMLSGHVPDAVWGLAALDILELNNNFLEGTISPAIANAVNLSTLRLENNSFSGSLPAEIGKLLNLSVELSVSYNRFTGSLPAELGRLQQLNSLHVSFNFFSGKIPQEIGLCRQLTSLDLSHNRLSGPIPESLGNLPVILFIDLSNNKLTGEIPSSLYLMASPSSINVSYNDLSGVVPPSAGQLAFNSSSFIGNSGLCGEKLLGVKQCKRPSKLLEAMLAGVFATAFMLLVLGLLTLYKLHGPFVIKRRYKFQRRNSWSLTSFHKVGFSEEDILSSLDEDNVIGSGGAGKVYRTTLKNGDIVAVKKLWSCNKATAQCNGAADEAAHEYVHAGAHELAGMSAPDRGFRAEIATLGKIRHKNIVKLLCCCSSNDTKLLVYEYLANGSLGDLLHGSGRASCKPGFCLDWESRYKIALGAAQGLAYLHHDCSPPIVHRDFKSNNILLDAHLNAHVADFGVAKVLPPPPVGAGHTNTLTLPEALDVNAAAASSAAEAKSVMDSSLLQSSCIAGSYGYIAPEHAYTSKVTEKSDIYSFGVVLLELVTGKKPVAPEVFGDNMDIVKWVCHTLSVHPNLEDGVKETLDPRIAFGSVKEHMLLVLRVALLCTTALPSQRPSMRQVVDMLLQAHPTPPLTCKVKHQL